MKPSVGRLARIKRLKEKIARNEDVIAVLTQWQATQKAAEVVAAAFKRRATPRKVRP